VEGLALLLGFLVVSEELLTEELGSVELEPLGALFCQCNY